MYFGIYMDMDDVFRGNLYGVYRGPEIIGYSLVLVKRVHYLSREWC